MIAETVTDHFARLAFIAGAAVGGGGGFWLGGCAWRLVMRNPLGWVLRAYRELFADIAYLCETGQLRARKTQGGPPTVRSAAALFRPREP